MIGGVTSTAIPSIPVLGRTLRVPVGSPAESTISTGTPELPEETISTSQGRGEGGSRPPLPCTVLRYQSPSGHKLISSLSSPLKPSSPKRVEGEEWRDCELSDDNEQTGMPSLFVNGRCLGNGNPPTARLLSTLKTSSFQEGNNLCKNGDNEEINDGVFDDKTLKNDNPSCTEEIKAARRILHSKEVSGPLPISLSLYRHLNKSSHSPSRCKSILKNRTSSPWGRGLTTDTNTISFNPLDCPLESLSCTHSQYSRQRTDKHVSFSPNLIVIKYRKYNYSNEVSRAATH